MDAERDGADAGVSYGVTACDGYGRRLMPTPDKRTVSTVIPQPRSNTVSTSTKLRQSVYTKCPKTALPHSPFHPPQKLPTLSTPSTPLPTWRASAGELGGVGRRGDEAVSESPEVDGYDQ